MGTGHRLAGACSSLAVGSVLGWPAWQVAAGTAVGAVVATWPDMDQRRWWRLWDRVLPDEWLGHGGPMRHRGVTHWWGIPAGAGLSAGWWAATASGWSQTSRAGFLVAVIGAVGMLIAAHQRAIAGFVAAWVLHLAGAVYLASLASGYGYVAVWVVIFGVWSHLVADFAFGRRCPQEGRGPGIPLAPWWAHHGLGLDTDGMLERWLVTPGLLVLLGWLGWLQVHS